MAREIELAGIPVVVVTNLTDIAVSIGPNRVVQGSSIPHPLGNPSLDQEQEFEFRRKLVSTAISALETDISCQTVFTAP